MADSFQIQHEVLIDAPVDVVWRTITEPDQIQQWFADRVELELAPGGRGRLSFPTENHTFSLVVEDVDPPNLFSFRWNHPEGTLPVAGNSTLVEFTLVGEGERTRLRVVESGLDAITWPVADRQHFADEHRQGWASFLGRLTRLIAERPRE